jgi:hypothetical protein
MPHLDATEYSIGSRTIEYDPALALFFFRLTASSHLVASVPTTVMDQQTPPVDDDLGPVALAICTPMLAVALVLYGVRVVPRIRPKYRLDWADHIVSLAIVSLSYPAFHTDRS